MELTKTTTKYKQTELGLIPEDWEVKTLKDVGEVKMCRRIFNSETKAQGDIPFYKIGTFGKEPDAFITRELYDDYRKRFSFPKIGDILISAAGTIGRTMIYEGKDAYFQDSNIVWIDNNNNIVSNEFLNYFYEVVNYRTEGGTIQRLYNNIIYATSIICPPKEEQKAIAQVLSDTYTLIQTLEQKLAKKRAIKQGAMQQLLTPEEDWEVRKLGDLIYSFQNGYGFSANGYVDSGIPIVTMAHIGLNGAFQYNESKMNFWQSKDFDILKNFHLKDGDLIIAMTDVTPNKNLIGRMAIVKSRKTLLLNQRVGLLRVDSSKLNSTYLKTYSNMEKWRNYCIGSASLGVQANIGTKDILNGLIELPSIEKQTRIATILSDMDAEIAQLEQKLDKYKLLKQGLMQELLTGRIRLV